MNENRCYLWSDGFIKTSYNSSALTCGCWVLSNFAKDPIFGTDRAIIAHIEWVFLLSKKLFLGAITELRPNF